MGRGESEGIDLSLGALRARAMRVQAAPAHSSPDPGGVEVAEAAAADQSTRPTITITTLEMLSDDEAEEILETHRVVASNQTIDAIRESAENIADGLREVEELDPTEHADGEDLALILPPSFERYYTKEFLERLVEEVPQTVEKLVGRERFENTAQEMLAYSILRGASLVSYARSPEDQDQIDLVQAEADYLSEDAFEDTDFLMLWNERLDGIEDSEIGERMGVVNLHPRDWLKPFRSS